MSIYIIIFLRILNTYKCCYRYLKQLRKNREAEDKLMKNVKGWETGTLYGEPVYKTVDKSKLIEPSLNEYYVHAPPKTLLDRAYWHKWL